PAWPEEDVSSDLGAGRIIVPLNRSLDAIVALPWFREVVRGRLLGGAWVAPIIEGYGHATRAICRDRRLELVGEVAHRACIVGKVAGAPALPPVSRAIDCYVVVSVTLARGSCSVL